MMPWCYLHIVLQVCLCRGQEQRSQNSAEFLRVTGGRQLSNWVCKLPIGDAERRGGYASWNRCLRVGVLNPLPKEKKRWRKTLGYILHLRSGIAVHNCSFTWRFQKAVAKWASQWQSPVLHRTVSLWGWGSDWGNACSEAGGAASRALNLLSCSAQDGISCFIFS